MKEIVITEKIIRRELWILLGCFIFAVLFDLTSIIIYKRPAIEIITTIGYEVVIALGTYCILWVIRIIVWLVSRLFKKNK